MTSVALTMRDTWLRVSVRADVVALGGLAALCTALVTLTWGTWGDLASDTGYDLLAAERLADGQVPYADFTYYYGPLGLALLGLVFSVTGVGIAAAVALGLLLAGTIVAATYALARTQTGPTGSFLAAAIVAPVAFAPNNFSFVLPHTYSVTVGLVALLGFVLAAGRFAASADRRWLLAAGTGAGLVGLTRPEFELALLVAAGLWLGLRMRAGVSSRRELLLFAGPAAGIPAAVYGAFLTSVSPHRLVFENLYPVEELQAAGNTLLESHAPMTLASFADVGAKLFLYAAGAVALILLARTIARPGRLQRPTVVLVVLGAVLALAGSIARPETLRYYLEFAYGWIPAGALIATAVMVRRFRRRSGAWAPADQITLIAAAVLAVLAVKTYAVFLIHAPEVQPAVYALPFAAVFLARLHLVELVRTRPAFLLGAAWLAFLAAAGIGLTLKDARSESATVSGPRGTIAEAPAAANVYRAALRTITESTAPGEPILLAPQLTWAYVIAGRENPLPNLSLLPGALPDEVDERRAIARLEGAGVRLAIIDRRPYAEYGHDSFGSSFDRVLGAWIQKNFVFTRTLGGPPPAPRLEIWSRRAT